MSILLGVICGVFLAAAVAALGVNRRPGRMIGRLVINRKVLESYHLFQKITWRDWFESNMRAQTGQSLERPFGSNLHHFYWDRLQFNPVYVTQQSTGPDQPVMTKIVLGPLAQKPLVLNIPILIGGMSYGNALSVKAKVALAKAATLAGTAENSGNGPYLIEERQFSQKFILQLSRGFWSKTVPVLQQADMIEIGLGHGAWNSAPVRIKGYKVNEAFADRAGVIPNLELLMEARLPEGDYPAALKKYIADLKGITGGVPIAVKIGATHYLEKELAIFIDCGVDVLVIDGAEGGTHGGPTILLDDLGLPTFPSLCRAVQFLEHEGCLKKMVSLVVGGGLYSPDDFLKCLALGADAIIIGTIASLAMTHTQLTKAIPWEPPTGLIFHLAKEEQKLDPDLAAHHLGNFLDSCVREMQLVARVLGKKDLRDINRADLVALDPLYAKIARVAYLDP